MASVACLSGCMGLEQLNESKNSIESTDTEVPVTTTNNQLSSDFYRALIEEGQYKPSQSRGVSLSLNSGYNMKNFETGLVEVAQRAFPSDQYYFQEGQVLDHDTIKKWLGRKSDQNKDGLNPAAVESGERQPYYLAQILEQDYIVQNNKTYQLEGMAIGLAMNTEDVYTEDGREYKSEIDEETMKQKGKEIAGTILQRLRENEALRNVPIVFGIFKQAPSDDLAGGVYIFEATSTKGALIPQWIDLKKEIKVFPQLEGNPTPDATRFENFRTNVEGFFPNLSGVTGKASYQDGALEKLQVNIMTQFYGETEIIAFAQHVTDMATKYLKYNIPVEIQIQSINGQEALIIQNPEKDQFMYYIYQ